MRSQGISQRHMLVLRAAPGVHHSKNFEERSRWILQEAPGVSHSKGFNKSSWIAADYHRGVLMDGLEMFDWLTPDAWFC